MPNDPDIAGYSLGLLHKISKELSHHRSSTIQAQVDQFCKIYYNPSIRQLRKQTRIASLLLFIRPNLSFQPYTHKDEPRLQSLSASLRIH